MAHSHTRGAELLTHALTPSIDLARLVELLCESLTTLGGVPGGFLTFQNSQAKFNVAEVLNRLETLPEFTRLCQGGDDAGFLRLAKAPSGYASAKMGSLLAPGTEKRASAALDRLRTIFGEALDRGLSMEPAGALCFESLEALLEALHSKLGIKATAPPRLATVHAVGFAARNRKPAERSGDVARVISAVETVQAGSWFKDFQKGIANHFRNNDHDDDEIDPILDAIQEQRGMPGSEIHRFESFLADEALSRVRLRVGFGLMRALAEKSGHPGFMGYVSRAIGGFERFASLCGEDLELDASAAYGQSSVVRFGEFLRNSAAYRALPVWAWWTTQFFETVDQSDGGFTARREVCYRFTVNGTVPETGKCAFESRLDRIEKRLCDPDAKNKGASCKTALAQLVFLRLAIPAGVDDPHSFDIRREAEDLAARLKTDPLNTVRALLHELRHRIPEVTEFAKALIDTIKTNPDLIENTHRKLGRLCVSIHRQAVDWPKLMAASNFSTGDMLARPDADSDFEKSTWLKYLEVTPNVVEHTGSLVSFPVDTHLDERSLTLTGEKRDLSVSRLAGPKALAVRVIPLKPNKAGTGWSLSDKFTGEFDGLPGAVIGYDRHSLMLQKPKKYQDKTVLEQARAAKGVAFALLSYTFLLELGRSLGRRADSENPALYMLRLQPGGKQSKEPDGNDTVYAACHAIELALARDFNVRMQGLDTDGDQDTLFFRKRNSLAALRAGAPLRISGDGVVDRLSILTYSTRPCDSHPDFPGTEKFLLVVRRYDARQQEGWMDIQAGRTKTFVMEGTGEFWDPTPVLEEIADIERSGGRHVALLSHHYGNRHIGRASERHAPHSSRDFLESVCGKFPEVCLYPLRRDVFPATRLRTRRGGESGFEVADFKGHGGMYGRRELELLLGSDPAYRNSQPIYTFATLAVVTERGRPQSGFCTYFFDMDSRLSNLQWCEAVRQNILGLTPATQAIRASILAALRGLHYLESERSADKGQVLPVLDAFAWANPSQQGSTGEWKVVSSRRGGDLWLSFPALLGQAVKVYQKPSHGPKSREER
ncbi:hypothetical protein SAMN02949497_1617 [Methylomagnum ishizawai]|uniref:Uncharacterized protein n=1 Tax=Methylomagnum ishizawai TaxID=1760988 RepID=A0A1Y6CVF1_9GAMM|nr:hypothetical protein [Methylomagnum ishizawai]SMF94307.1 hypothetical protein SAMN02949497_1617 [Methylomagnum ishizawai]